MVIVGAGTAGCVLATRLSEIAKISILLIEAGGEENDFNQMTALWPYNQFSEFNWGYYTTPQKYSCLGKLFTINSHLITLNSRNEQLTMYNC